VTLRSADVSYARFAEAMTAYTAGRYADAASGLEAVVSTRPSASALLFLGISYLMLDRTADGIGALQRCLQAGDAAYTEDAQFFLAKAYLRSGDHAAAARALLAVARGNGPRAQDARALQDALASIGAR
jgi:tetratricopeptide (TPR) repeat protein